MTTPGEGCEDAKDEGATFVLEELAKALGIAQWVIHDGTETWVGDVTATLFGILQMGNVLDPETNELVATRETARANAATAERDALRQELDDNADSAAHVSAYQATAMSNLERALKAEAERDAMRGHIVDMQVLAYGWMVAHDRLKAGEPYNLPKPADVPSLVAERDAALARMAVLEAWLRRMIDTASTYSAGRCAHRVTQEIADARSLLTKPTAGDQT